MGASPRYLVLLLLAILCPPLPVFIKRGCSQDFLLSILLTLFLFLPGVIHAVLIVYMYEDSHRDRDGFYKGLENGGYGSNSDLARKEKFRSSYVPSANTVVPYPPGRFQGFAGAGGGSPVAVTAAGGGGAGGKMARPWIAGDAIILEPQAVLHRGWYA